MEGLLKKIQWFFTGLRLILPHLPMFVWIAFSRMIQSVIAYWRDTQTIVQGIADEHTDKSIEGQLTTEYDSLVFWVCLSIASFLFLVAWLIQAWIMVEGLRLLVTWLF